MSPDAGRPTLHVLGPVALYPPAGGSAAPVVTQPRQLAVLAYLLLARPRRLHSRDTLVALLWPESDEHQGRHGLRNALHALRKAIGADQLTASGDGLVGVAPGTVACDALDAEAHLAREEWGEALELYQGELLEGFHVSGGEAFEEWLTQERARLREQMAHAAASLSDARHAAGDLAGAVRAAEQRTRIAPLEEGAHRQLISLLLAQGEPGAARGVYERFAARLHAELGTAPSARMAELLRRGDGATAADGGSRPDAQAAPVHAIAVLPWSHGGTLADGDELAEGLTASLTSVLARVPTLHVPALGVVRRLGALDTDAQAAGRELGVDAVVVGRVADAGSACRLRLEVIRVHDGRLLWGDARTARRERLHAVPHELAIGICQAIGVAPGDTLRHAVPSVAAGAGDAWVHYVRGQYHFLRAAANGDPGELETARTFFERALERDPACAPAYAGLANFHAVAAARGIRTPFEQEFERTIELSRQAAALDPTLAVPHVHFGVKAMYLDGDLAEAGRQFRRAIEVEPTNAEGHRFLAIWLGLQGDAEASLAHFAEAVRHEPDMPIYRNGLADALQRQGRHAEAEAELRRALALDARYGPARERLLRCLEATGRWDEAVRLRCDAGQPDAERFARAFAERGVAGYRAERERELRGVIERLAPRAAEATPSVPGDRFNPVELQLALAHAELGEWEAARAWRERACRARPWRAAWFEARPELVRVG